MARENATMDYLWLDGKLHITILGTSSGNQTIVFDPAKASAENRARAHNFGWQQRHADGGAVERTDPKTGLQRTDVEMADIRVARVTAIRDHNESGSTEWKIRVAAPSEDTAGMTVMAVMRWRGVGVDEANRLVDARAEKLGITRTVMLRRLAATPEIAAILAEMRAERATQSAEDLLGELAE